MAWGWAGWGRGKLLSVGFWVVAPMDAAHGPLPTSSDQMARRPTPPVHCRALAAPAALLMTVGQGAFRGLQDMRTPLAITLAANGINLALDTVLILGLGWGVKGAATATTTAEWVAALAYMGVLYNRRDALGGLHPRLVLGSTLTAALAEMVPFLKAGGAMLMRTGLLLGTKTLASATAARCTELQWVGWGIQGILGGTALESCGPAIVGPPCLPATRVPCLPSLSCPAPTTPARPHTHAARPPTQAGRGAGGGTSGGHPALAAVQPCSGQRGHCGAEPRGSAAGEGGRPRGTCRVQPPAGAGPGRRGGACSCLLAGRALDSGHLLQ